VKTLLVSGPDGVRQAAALLAAGELAALPTETVYGLGASALDPIACARIFEAKQRPLSDPLIVHIPDESWLYRLADPVGCALDLALTFWPGPLTMVLPRSAEVPDIVTSGQDTVALRRSAHPVFQQVATAFGQPIAAPSANRFGRISPTSAAHVLEELDGAIPLILDGGPCSHGIESTIVAVEEHGLRILRHGPITEEQLSAFAPILSGSSDIAAPGNLKSHYAPRTPLTIADPSTPPPGRIGLLAFTAPVDGYAEVECLSPDGDLREAASRLFAAMRRLDNAGLDAIIAEPIPESGLGVAIMERLRKAAARE